MEGVPPTYNYKEAFAEPMCHPDPPDWPCGMPQRGPGRPGFHGAGGEGSQVIIPFIIVERGLSWVPFEIPPLPTAVGILAMTKSLVLCPRHACGAKLPAK